MGGERLDGNAGARRTAWACINRPDRTPCRIRRYQTPSTRKPTHPTLHPPPQSSPAAPLIRCDAALRAVTEQASLGLAALQEAVRGHLAPPPPAVLEVAVPAGGPSPSHPACYDLVTEVPMSAALPAFAEPDAGAAAELEAADAALAAAVAAAGEAARRRAFLLAFAGSPVDAVHHLVAAQARDLRIAAGGDALDVLPPADVFAERWVEDAALRVMAARGAAAG